MAIPASQRCEGVIIRKGDGMKLLPEAAGAAVGTGEAHCPVSRPNYVGSPTGSLKSAWRGHKSRKFSRVAARAFNVSRRGRTREQSQEPWFMTTP
jgi:hypothetical protein